MPLIKSSECGKEISSNASACPFCGNPIAQKNVQQSPIVQAPIVIEQTAKKWKLVKLISVIVIVVGFFMMANGSAQGSSGATLGAMGIMFMFIGFIGLIVGKFGAWWNHR